MNLRKDHQCVCVRCSINYTTCLLQFLFCGSVLLAREARNHVCCVLMGLSGVCLFVCLLVVITTTTTTANECNI